MAANNSELQQLLLRYNNSDGEDIERMREVLQTTSVEVRYRTLIDVRGMYQDTAVHRGAWIDDLDSLKCMMSGFTSDQSYNVLKIQINPLVKYTPLYLTADQGYTDITKFLLSKLSQEQRFNILKIEDIVGSTPLHLAAEKNHTADLLAMLTSVSADQQKKLLNIKGNEGKTIADIAPLPKLPYDVVGWTKIELDVTNQKLAEVQTQCSEQKATIDQLEADLAEQREDNVRHAQELDQKVEAAEKEQKATIDQLEADLAEQREGNARQAQELNQKLEAAEKEQKATIDQLEADLAEQREDNARQDQELSNAKEQVVLLLTSNAELRIDMGRQVRDQDKKLEAAEREQKATIGQLEADLAEQREDNARQAEELRSLVDRQERMENMMEEMERLLRQPICIGPEMDQEYEG